jgi:hypothetical protein
MQSWVSLMVCNFAVLASAFLKLSNTTPDGTIYSAAGKRVGAIPPPRSPTSLSPVQTGRNSVSEAERSRSVTLSELGMTIDFELSDVSAMSTTKSLSPPPTIVFDGQQVDSGV